VDSVIRGFSEGMRHVREGDRIIITMTPSSATALASDGHPGKLDTGLRLRDSGGQAADVCEAHPRRIAAGTVDEAIAKAKATPNLKEHYVSASSIQAARARRIVRRRAPTRRCSHWDSRFCGRVSTASGVAVFRRREATNPQPSRATKPL
jgi:hypothetical protein